LRKRRLVESANDSFQGFIKLFRRSDHVATRNEGLASMFVYALK
jgi:hypothetical protein